MSKQFSKMTGGAVRGDSCGSGAFGAKRKKKGGGTRKHGGIDITVKPGADVRSPIDGEITREAKPYAGYSGLEIAGNGSWSGYTVRIFYVTDFKTGPVEAGAIIAKAQDVAKTCSGMKNHIHVELRMNGTLQDPTSYVNE